MTLPTPTMIARTDRQLALRTAVLIAVALVVARSALYLVRGTVSFDSDQAIIGLMGKHLMERRALPLFLYGQNYILAVEAWMAAPVFWVAGVSIGTLKFPLLVVNAAVAALLVVLLHRDAGVRPAHAVIAALFFAWPPVSTSATLLEAMGGNVEPFLYILLLWMLRRRPAWFGLVGGIGFLQREFVLYGFAAMFLIELADGELRTRAGWTRWFERLRVAVVVWLAFQWLRQFSTPAGPGTTMRSLHAASNDILEAVGRFCFSPSAAGLGVWRLVTIHWPALFGTSVIPLGPFVVSAKSQGMPGLGLLLGTAIALMAWRLVVAGQQGRAGWRRHELCVYLLLVGTMSPFVYAVGRCGNVGLLTLRYDLLSLLAAVGLAAWFFSMEENRAVRRTAAGLIVAWALAVTAGHAALWGEYFPRPPVNAKVQVARAIEAVGVRYAQADYWLCYYITFLTDERVIVGSDGLTRVPLYDNLYEEHKAEAVRIERRPCAGGREMAGVYFCQP